jgi:hypothetical protein
MRTLTAALGAAALAAAVLTLPGAGTALAENDRACTNSSNDRGLLVVDALNCDDVDLLSVAHLQRSTHDSGNDYDNSYNNTTTTTNHQDP